MRAVGASEALLSVAAPAGNDGRPSFKFKLHCTAKPASSLLSYDRVGSLIRILVEF